MQTNEQVADRARLPYYRADEVRERWDVVETPDGQAVAFSLGALFGENTHGVRYLDRFEIADGKNVPQEVWNDLDESGALQRALDTAANRSWPPARALPAGMRCALCRPTLVAR